MASHALAKNTPDPKDCGKSPLILLQAGNVVLINVIGNLMCDNLADASCLLWCILDGKNGDVVVTANGGLNHQRVAESNTANLTEIEEHFINYLKSDTRIVKELPDELQSLDLEAIGSVITDEDIMKEAKPSFYRKCVNHILLKNRVVHFTGFANRLAFDPIPFHLQRLRCRCNFHALQFVPKIQVAGSLILQRMRQGSRQPGPLEQYLVGPYAKTNMKKRTGHVVKGSRYLAHRLRFEIDMVAHSLSESGGGEDERNELQAYREIHFPALTVLKKSKKHYKFCMRPLWDSGLPSPAALRAEGLCPLAPEKVVLMLAALGFNSKTHISGGCSNVWRNVKVGIWSPKTICLHHQKLNHLGTFHLRAGLHRLLAAIAFTMTDSGSQLSALMSGCRMYYGGGQMPTIRPNKHRLANMFLKNSTIEWQAVVVELGMFAWPNSKPNNASDELVVAFAQIFIFYPIILYYSLSWVPSGPIVNQVGDSSTVTPFGGSTEHRYVSGLLSTFFTVRWTTRDPVSAVIVTDGRFRSDGWLSEWLQDPPVAASIVSGFMLGKEHKKLTYSPSPGFGSSMYHSES
ncbi:hypothetical protein Ancab_033435 [Ancistrocladus abbreviatus]